MTDDPIIEAAIEAAGEALRDPFIFVNDIDTAARKAIRAAAPILRQHYIREGRELAAKAILANIERVLREACESLPAETALAIAGLARGGEDE